MYNKWRLNKTQFWLGLIALMSLVYFVVSVFRAVAVFPGYSWTENFLSDLGQSWTHNAAQIYNPAGVILGISLISHSATLTINQSKGDYWLRAFSMISAFGIIILGLTPYDTHTFLHNCALATWLVGLILTIISHFILLRETNRTSILGILLMAGVLITGFGYIFAGKSSWHVIFQKSLVAACLIWYLHFFIVVSTTLYSTISSTRDRNDKLALKYIGVLKNRHRK